MPNRSTSRKYFQEYEIFFKGNRKDDGNGVMLLIMSK